MKFRIFQVVAVLAVSTAPYVRSFDNFFNSFKQGASAVGNTLQSTKESIDALVQVVGSVEVSVQKINQQVATITKAATGIVTNNAQESIKNSFATINGALETTMALLPAVQDLSKVLEVVGTRLLPVISQYPGVQTQITNDISKVSTQVASVTAEVNKVKAALDIWLPKIKTLSTSLGKHAAEIASQVEGAIVDTKKIF